MSSSTLRRMNISTYHEWGSIDHTLYLIKREESEIRKWEDWLSYMVIQGEKYIQTAMDNYARYRKDLKRQIRWNNKAFDRDFSVVGDYMELTEASQ